MDFPLILDEVRKAAKEALDSLEYESINFRKDESSLGFFIADHHGNQSCLNHFKNSSKQIAFLIKNKINFIFCEFFILEPTSHDFPIDANWKGFKIWQNIFNHYDTSLEKRLHTVIELDTLDRWMEDSIRCAINACFIMEPNDFVESNPTLRIRVIANALLWLSFFSQENVHCYGIDCFQHSNGENRLALTNPVWAEWVCIRWDGKSPWAMLAGKSHWALDDLDEEVVKSESVFLSNILSQRLKSYNLPSQVKFIQ